MNKGGFSWKTLLGITNAKRQFARQTGIPTTKSGVERKVGRMVLDLLFGKRRRTEAGFRGWLANAIAT